MFIITNKHQHTFGVRKTISDYNDNYILLVFIGTKDIFRKFNLVGYLETSRKISIAKYVK